jgi:hypothetical protein
MWKEKDCRLFGNISLEIGWQILFNLAQGLVQNYIASGNTAM